MAAKVDFPIIDADSHLSEDLDRLRELTDARYRHYAPRMLDQGTGELFYIGGAYMPQPPGMSWGETITRGAYRRGNRRPMKYLEGERVGFDPKERLKMMDEHGVWGSVIFPSQGLFSGAIREPEIAAGVARGVNRYVAEFCSADTDRLWNTATVPIADPQLAIEEARYAVKELNAVAIFSPSGVHGPQPPYHAMYDPFFDAIAELGVPFITHTGAAVIGRSMAADRFPNLFPAYHMTTHVVEAMIAGLGILAYGVLDKRPELKFGMFEVGAGWAPFWFDRLNERHEDMGWMMPDMRTPPLETFKERCLVTVEGGEANLHATMEFFGGRSVAWSSDVPHFDCENEGRPDELVDHERLSKSDKRRLLHDNAIEFFGLKLPKRAR